MLSDHASSSDAQPQSPWFATDVRIVCMSAFDMLMDLGFGTLGNASKSSKFNLPAPRSVHYDQCRPTYTSENLRQIFV